ncbi:MAG TPA: hypothetical protein DSN98_06550 [Thermoplasmata archaeon]|jgi:hypothetical protein|nr:MAG TPA: hypothetical protein DSN98_06550 [Thermoplasmata archaeon]
MVKKKRLAVFASILVIGFVLLIGFYWSGYIVFNGPIPSFNPSPTNPSDVPSETEKTTKLSIENIKGRFNKIYVDIKNIGEKDAIKVNWSISVTGGILKRINILTTGTIDSLSANMVKTIKTDKFFLGFGRINIEVTVEAAQISPFTNTARGFIVFFFLIGVRV